MEKLKKIKKIKDPARFENSQKESGLGKRGNIKIKMVAISSWGVNKWTSRVAESYWGATEVFLSH